MTKAKQKPELPADLMEEIKTRLTERVDEIERYNIPQNSDDHLMLVAIPLAREVIEDVTFADETIDRITPWLNSGETTHNTHSRHSRVEELAQRFAVDLVRHFRPEFSS